MEIVNQERVVEYLEELQCKEDTNDCYAAALGGETLTRNPHLDEVIPCLGILESFIVVGCYMQHFLGCVFLRIFQRKRVIGCLGIMVIAKSIYCCYSNFVYKFF